MSNIMLITATQEDYDSWKRGDLFLNMATGEFVDIVEGTNIRLKLLKHWQTVEDSLIYPESFDDLFADDKLRAPLNYEEFKNLTIHVDKKVLNGVISLVVKLAFIYL